MLYSKNISSVFILILLFVLFPSCKKNTPFEFRKIVFEYEYINYAWGYNHSGWFIDTTGLVYYHKSVNEHEIWNSADNSGYLSEGALQQNFNLSDTVIYTLNKTEVKGKAALNRFVTTDNFSEILHPMADAGIGTLYCYVWDKEVLKYRRLFLAESGDLRQANNDPDAILLTHWLIDKGNNQIKYFFWSE